MPLLTLKNDLYFRQYIELDNKKLLRCINSKYEDIELNNNFEVKRLYRSAKAKKTKITSLLFTQQN